MKTRRLGWTWVLVLAALITLAISAWRVVPMLSPGGATLRGDPRDLSSYGFDLGNLDVERDLVAGGARRDELGALSSPRSVSTEEADRVTRERRKRHQGKFLVGSDRVVGLTIEGEARAYPLRILNWHEVVNDTLGGVPIVVTFSGLCDSVVVFDRRSGAETLTFGVSGLLYNSNLLMYDRKPHERESSLWSQLAMRAVAGPTQGTKLTPLPASVATWEDWRQAYPQTSVITGRDDYLKIYKRNPYGRYLAQPGLRFPVRDQPSTLPGAIPPKARVAASLVDGTWRVWRLHAPAADAMNQGNLELRATRPPTFLAQSEKAPTAQSLWFAWRAIRGESGFVR